MATTPVFAPIGPDEIDFLGRDPVPARPYDDPAWYELGRKAIFLRNWIAIGHVCELPQPGSFIRRELEFAGASLLIVHGKDGAIRAFHNVCTHRGTQLTQDVEGKTSTFSCPYHRWSFGIESFGIAKSGRAASSASIAWVMMPMPASALPANTSWPPRATCMPKTGP